MELPKQVETFKKKLEPMGFTLGDPVGPDLNEQEYTAAGKEKPRKETLLVPFLNFANKVAVILSYHRAYSKRDSDSGKVVMVKNAKWTFGGGVVKWGLSYGRVEDRVGQLVLATQIVVKAVQAGRRRQVGDILDANIGCKRQVVVKDKDGAIRTRWRTYTVERDKSGKPTGVKENVDTKPGDEVLWESEF